jgi:glyceraldehyde 3-phosphate dehydrogenase
VNLWANQLFSSVEIAKVILSLDLPSKLDIGKLTYEYLLKKINIRCKTLCIGQIKRAKSSEEVQPKDVVLYGFGRIGRLLARE